jgi:twinkle protein
MANWNEVSLRLASEAEAIAMMLLPNGKRQGPEFAAGSVDGEAGSSLSVRVTGNKAGVWKDFATGATGDLIDLWAAVKGVPLKTAFEEASRYLGMATPALSTPTRAYVRPARPSATKPKGRVLQYLTEVRKLSAETIEAFKVIASKADDEIIFPYLRDGELINLKHLALERDARGKKVIRQAADAEPCLFGWDLIPDNAKSVLIVEGEIDAMSLLDYGVHALSINQGAGNHQWIDADFDRLERFQEIFLWFDNDEAGQKGAKDAATRLGLDRCRIVHFRLKDANEALQQGVPEAEIDEAIAAAQRIEPDDLRTPAAYLDELIRMFRDEPLATTGATLPWPAWQDRMRLRKGELTVWTGINSHGKSDVLGQIMNDLIKQGERVCAFSGEMRPAVFLRRLTTQACATLKPSDAFITAANAWMSGALWMYDRVGTVEQDKLLEAFRYAAKRYRVTHFVIDSLMKCGIAEDDLKGQKAFIDQLCDFKNEFSVHIHLVAHARKAADESFVPGKMDIKGTGAISDLADNVMCVWRNKAKEENRPSDSDEEDGRLYCHKQRATGFEGWMKLWFDPASLHFKQSARWHPRAYVEYSSLLDQPGAPA